jgi:hypothetical protein
MAGWRGRIGYGRISDPERRLMRVRQKKTQGGEGNAGMKRLSSL